MSSSNADESKRIGVVGAGSWGTALASSCGAKGHSVTLWAYEPEVAEGINRDHKNPLYLTDAELPTTVVATNVLEEAIAGAHLILFVVPAQLMRGYVRRVRDRLPADAPLVICSKGIERETLATMDRVFEEELPPRLHANIAVLSGPSFAREVARGRPTNVTVAAKNRDVARRVQSTLAARTFRIYTSSDPIGVEVGGALKNVIAIAVGASDGLNLGDNTRAGLITRGLDEITHLAVAMGARPETFLGLAGVGDLILTCAGEQSRNRQVGKALAAGKTTAEIQRDMKMVAEGIPTAESGFRLAERHGVEVPIIEQVYRVLYEGKTVAEAMKTLQDRDLKDEWSA